MRWANLVMAALFVYATVVQFNDPDGPAWIALYAAAALTSIAAFAGRPFRFLPWVLAAVGVAGAIWLGPRVLGKQHLFDSEEGREFLGLVIVALWIIVTLLFSRPRSGDPASGAPSNRGDRGAKV